MVQAYYDAIEEQGEEEMNEVKVLLVGDGGAGKTSLAHRLSDPNGDLPTQEERTRGIEIHDWKYRRKGKTHTVHIWDFGGQVMYDMVHQYFYSQRALYILMDSSRSGANENDSRLNQLLQSAELFGHGSKMLMIQNQHTGHEKMIDFGVLKKNYDFLTELQKTNLATKEGLKELREVLKKHIDQIPGMGVVMPKRWMKVRRAIQRLAKNHSTIPVEQFRKLCQKHGIEDENGQNILSRYFHRLGVHLHFQDDPSSTLSQLIILHREWATKATYKVFDSSTVQEASPKGTFEKKHLKEFWPEPEFKNFHPQLLDLMKQFKICFELRSTGKYLVPHMMEKMPPKDFCGEESCPLTFYYEYKFMPEGLVNQLSVGLHEKIAGENGDWVYSDGVVLEERGVLAELREIRQPDTSRIQVRIIGEDAHYMSELLIREIDKINERFNLERLKVQTLIPCNCSQCANNKEPYFLDYAQVKKDLQNPDPKFHFYYCLKSRDRIDFHSLLKTISHEALAEAEAYQRKNRIGQYGLEGEVRFRGEKGLEMAERMMTQDTSELKESMEEIKTQLADEGEKTRTHISSEEEKTREQVLSRLDELPEVLRENIKASDEKLLAGILGKLDEMELELSYAQDMVETVLKGTEDLFLQNSQQEDLLRAFQQVQKLKQEGPNIKEKLKISIPLFPTLIKYEAEMPVEVRKKFKAFWKKGGLNKLVL
ncbi:MAG: COR domain-containing protein [Bacteroidota bacterium]